MAANSETGFVSRLRSQSWYGDVKSIWDKYGIPEFVGAGVIADEDNSLQLQATGTDAPSIGLYQINLDAHHDVTREQAADPIYSTEWFAQKVAPILNSDPSLRDPSNIDRLVSKLEDAGWPGDRNSKEARSEFAKRIREMRDTAVALGGTGTPQPTRSQVQTGTWLDKLFGGGFVIGAGGIPIPTNPDSISSAAGDAVSAAKDAATNAIIKPVQDMVKTALIVLLCIALIVGGLLWLGALELKGAPQNDNTQPNVTIAPQVGGGRSVAPEAQGAGDLADVAFLA